jgi:HAD superfamily phosphoserine phosphatase-like hydrolase
MPPVIAVFDVDGTLLCGDSLRMAARRSRPPLGLLQAGLALIPGLWAWQLGRIATGAFKEQTLKWFRICDKVNQEEGWGRGEWLLPDLLRHLRPAALQRLRLHQERGDRVLLCSASPRMLLQPLADHLGVELIATELVKREGQWQPQLLGPNCKGPEKVRRLTSHLGPLDQLTIEAYGDSRGDKELLEISAIPHYRSFQARPNPYPASGTLQGLNKPAG